MKTKLIPVSLLTLVILAAWSFTPQATFQPQSKIWVTGTSSVHDWEMTAKTVAGSVHAPAVGDVEAVTVTVPVAEMTSSNGTMDKKAYDALKVKSHPTITYKLNAADLAQAVQNGTFELKTTGQLTLAGVTKPLTFSVKGQQLEDGSTRYTGSTPLLMSDFGIDPPRAMLGTLKTGNKVVVHFDVVVAQ